MGGRAMITVGSTHLPNPIEYSVTLQDIDSENTKRTETGLLNRDRVRAGVYKIQATWLVTKAQLSLITDALAPDQFSVTFFDPTTATKPTKSMYSGDRTGNLKYYDGNNDLWELSVSLIEY
jgi:hypothetical protein